MTARWTARSHRHAQVAGAASPQSLRPHDHLSSRPMDSGSHLAATQWRPSRNRVAMPAWGGIHRSVWSRMPSSHHWSAHKTLQQTKPIARAEPELGHETLSDVLCLHRVDPAASCIDPVWMTDGPTGKWDGVAVSCAEFRSAQEQSRLTTQQRSASISNSVLFFSHHVSLHNFHEYHESHRCLQPSDCVSEWHKEHTLASSHYAPKMGKVSIQLVEPQAACRRKRHGPETGTAK